MPWAQGHARGHLVADGPCGVVFVGRRGLYVCPAGHDPWFCGHDVWPMGASGAHGLSHVLWPVACSSSYGNFSSLITYK